MTPADSQPTTGWQLAVRLMAVAVLLTAFCQLTIRHWALWATGVRTGKATLVLPENDGAASRVVDTFAVFQPDELAGKQIWFGDRAWAVLGNTPTEIVVDAPTLEVQEAVDSHPAYITGVTSKGPLVKLALRVPGIGFTPSDVLLGLACLLLAVQLVIARRRPEWRLPPWSFFIYLAIGLLSLVDAAQLFDGSFQTPDAKAGIKEFLQLVEVLLVAYLFFQLVWRDRRARHWCTIALVAGLAALVLVGLAEYVAIINGHTLRGLADIGDWDSLLGFRYNPGRSGSAGTESSKNMLAAYLVVLVPFVLALVKLPIHFGWRLAIGALVAIASVCILNPFLLAAAVAGCLVVAATWRVRWGFAAVFGALLVVWLAACLVSPDHGKILMDSAALNRFADPYGLLPMPLKGKSSTNAPQWMFDQQKYVELQAALNAVGMSPILGHGLGNYQERINMFYSNSRLVSLAISKEPANFMEQDAHGQFVVAAVETGVVGLLALLALFAGVLQQAFASREQTDDPWDRALLAGVAGSLVAVLVGGWFVTFFVRGLGLILIALMALPAALAARSAAAEAPPKVTTSGIITE